VARLSNRLVEEFFKIRRIVSPDPPGVFFVFFWLRRVLDRRYILRYHARRPTSTKLLRHFRYSFNGIGIIKETHHSARLLRLLFQEKDFIVIS